MWWKRLERAQIAPTGEKVREHPRKLREKKYNSERAGIFFVLKSFWKWDAKVGIYRTGNYSEGKALYFCNFLALVIRKRGMTQTQQHPTPQPAPPSF